MRLAEVAWVGAGGRGGDFGGVGGGGCRCVGFEVWNYPRIVSGDYPLRSAFPLT